TRRRDRSGLQLARIVRNGPATSEAAIVTTAETNTRRDGDLPARGVTHYRGLTRGMLDRSATSGRCVLADLERDVGIVAQSRDRAEADHDDHGNHDRVFDCRRAVFALEELDDAFRELTHGGFSPNLLV